MNVIKLRVSGAKSYVVVKFYLYDEFIDYEEDGYMDTDIIQRKRFDSVVGVFNTLNEAKAYVKNLEHDDFENEYEIHEVKCL